jgi:endonuclease-3
MKRLSRAAASASSDAAKVAATKRPRAASAGGASRRAAGAGAGSGGAAGAGAGSGAGAAAAASRGASLPWREQLAAIRAMRRSQDAPVDTKGCERCADPSAPPAVQRFQTLVSLMLSSQTKDPVTWQAMENLKGQPAGGCTAAALAALPEDKLGALISKVGFWPTKAKNVREAAAHCAATLGGDIPPTLEGLLALRGVGPKMAHICMLAAWGVCTGIGVDTHVHRIANRLGWVKSKTPEETRAGLEALLPREEWAALNVLLVGHGQQTCTPLAPACDRCAAREMCPTGRRGGDRKKKELDW